MFENALIWHMKTCHTVVSLSTDIRIIYIFPFCINEFHYLKQLLYQLMDISIHGSFTYDINYIHYLELQFYQLTNISI